MNDTLDLVLMLLAAAVLVVVLFRSLDLPPIVGYLLVGTVIGPNSLNLLPETAGARHLAEFGIVFLMFSIGLEFSLPQLFSMKRIVFGLGLLQVVVTAVAVVPLAMLMGLSWQAGLALGGATAMSSTAVLSKLLTDRLELDSSHGRQVMGVLLFQDLAVVPLLILMPELSGGAGDVASSLAAAALKAAILLSVVLFLGQRLMRGWFFMVARRRSSELFMLNVLLITLGLAWLTEKAGLSLALGAFLAGMLISETEYRYQVEEDIKPFRDVLMGLFFVTVGMLLDMRVVADNLLLVVAILALLLLGKCAVAVGLSRAYGSTDGTALRTGLWLAAGGEFGFVLLAQSKALGSVPETALQVAIAALVLTQLGDTPPRPATHHASARPLREILKVPAYRIAVLSGLVSYAVMSFIMTATPISMHVHDGYSSGQTTAVISAHLLGMYLPSLATPLIVRWLGIRRMLVLGIVTMGLCIAISVVLGHAFIHYFAGLVLLGLGWNLMFVAATTLLTTTYSSEERFRAQGFNDFAIFGSQKFLISPLLPSFEGQVLAGQFIVAFDKAGPAA